MFTDSRPIEYVMMTQQQTMTQTAAQTSTLATQTVGATETVPSVTTATITHTSVLSGSQTVSPTVQQTLEPVITVHQTSTFTQIHTITGHSDTLMSTQVTVQSETVTVQVTSSVTESAYPTSSLVATLTATLVSSYTTTSTTLPASTITVMSVPPHTTHIGQINVTQSTTPVLYSTAITTIHTTTAVYHTVTAVRTLEMQEQTLLVVPIVTTVGSSGEGDEYSNTMEDSAYGQSIVIATVFSCLGGVAVGAVAMHYLREKVLRNTRLHK